MPDAEIAKDSQILVDQIFHFWSLPHVKCFKILLEQLVFLPTMAFKLAP